MRRLILGLALAAILGPAPLAAAGQTEGGPAVRNPDSAVRVFVTIQPQLYFVRRIGGQRVEVEALVEPGRDPHTFDPSPRQITRLASANLYFSIGMPFEAGLLPKLAQTNPAMRMVDTLAGLELLFGTPHYHYDEQGTPYLHGADEPDTHVWLGPNEVRHQIRLIRDALIRLDPAGAELYTANHAAFDAEIVAMDRRFAELLAPQRGRSILVFHPAFAYFTNTYGISQKAIELEGKEPSPRHLERMIDQALRDGTRVIFTQPEFPLRSAEIIARAIGGRVVSLNPLDPDWPSVMERIAEAIAGATF